MVNRFAELRARHPLFSYERYDAEETPDGLRVVFHFQLGTHAAFAPTLFIPRPPAGWAMSPSNPLIQRMIFCVGMVELVSYWKAACAPQVEIRAGTLETGEIAWWKKLYFLGLGEFFYTNGIETSEEEFMDLVAEPGEPRTAVPVPPRPDTLIPIGGGKDSIVSMEVLAESHATNRLLFINASAASLRCAARGGYDEHQQVRVKRTIHPALLELNAQGYLNGHTPFSAMLAFVSVLTAALHGLGRIALSNESSANESTVLGSTVNHQYSKTFEFESDFQSYVTRYLATGIHYFSLLRPVNELQIAGLLCQRPQYLPDFRSCNAGSKKGIWCGACAKCLFVAVMLSPFLGEGGMMGVFGVNPLDQMELLPLLADLLGLTEAKPFECVGTVSEVRAALALALARAGQFAPDAPLPALLAHVKAKHAALLPSAEAAASLLRDWNPEHAVPDELVLVLKRELETLRSCN